MPVAFTAAYASQAAAPISLGANSSATWRQNTTTSALSFTGNVGDTIIVKAATGQPTTTVTSVSNGYTGTVTKGVVDAFTQVVYETASSSVAPIWFYVGTVTTAGGFNIAVGVTTTASTTQLGNFWVERYTGVVVPSAWNAAAYTTPDKTSPFTASFTTQTPAAVVTWLAADWNGAVTSYSGFTYQSGAVATRQSLNSTAGGLDMYGAYQTVATPGATTIGYTKSTSNQWITFGALELPSVSSVNTGQFLPFF